MVVERSTHRSQTRGRRNVIEDRDIEIECECHFGIECATRGSHPVIAVIQVRSLSFARALNLRKLTPRAHAHASSNEQERADAIRFVHA